MKIEVGWNGQMVEFSNRSAMSCSFDVALVFDLNFHLFLHFCRMSRSIAPLSQCLLPLRRVSRAAAKFLAPARHASKEDWTASRTGSASFGVTLSC